MSQNAFVLRIAHGETDLVQEALQSNQLIIGWAWAEGLLDPNLDWWAFREIVRRTYYPEDETMHKAGRAAGQLWKFIRDMEPKDVVVVPYGPEFFVAEVTGDATYDPAKVEEDSAYRRCVRWLNDRKPIPRSLARSALVSRMKTYGTCAGAGDLVEEIKECLTLAQHGEAPTFQNDLHRRLVRETLAEMRSGRMDSYGFEHLLGTVMKRLGAVDVEVRARNQDMGADLIAVFRLAGAFQQRIAIQAKHWQPEPPVDAGVVEQLISGIEAESASLGLVVTSGTIGPGAKEAAQRYFDDKGILIELLDGEQLSTLIVEYGLYTR